MTREEYEKTYIRMMNSLRKNSKGEHSCKAVNCTDGCPFKPVCIKKDSLIYNALKCVEIVEQWGKDHPIVTNADKFKEVWGVEPRAIDFPHNLLCPRRIGLNIPCKERCTGIVCDKCKIDFWESEYIEPDGK